MLSIDNFLSSNNMRLDQQLKFTAEIDKMTSILRRTVLIDQSRRENDAEHSWHIAVMAMLFSEYAGNEYPHVWNETLSYGGLIELIYRRN